MWITTFGRILPYIVQMRPVADGWTVYIWNREHERIAYVPLPHKLTRRQLRGLSYDGVIDGPDGGNQWVWLYNGQCPPDTGAHWCAYARRLEWIARLPIDYSRALESDCPFIGDPAPKQILMRPPRLVN